MCNSQENQLKECAKNNIFYRLKFSFAGGLPDPEVDLFFYCSDFSSYSFT